MPARRFDELDTSLDVDYSRLETEDGSCSVAELHHAARNGDGFLSRAEYLAGQRNQAKDREALTATSSRA